MLTTGAFTHHEAVLGWRGRSTGQVGKVVAKPGRTTYGWDGRNPGSVGLDLDGIARMRDAGNLFVMMKLCRTAACSVHGGRLGRDTKLVDLGMAVRVPMASSAQLADLDRVS